MMAIFCLSVWVLTSKMCPTGENSAAVNIYNICSGKLFSSHFVLKCLLLAHLGGGGGELPWWLSCKEYACNARDLSSIPGLGRSPGEGNIYPLQYSGLENFIDCIGHGVPKSRTYLSNFHFHFHLVGSTGPVGDDINMSNCSYSLKNF